MRCFNLLLWCTFASSAFAQTHKRPLVQKTAEKTAEYALLRGHITNYTDKMLEYTIQGYLDDDDKNIVVHNDGTFTEKIKLDNPYKNITLFPGDESIPIVFTDKDTVDVSWDQKNIAKTLKFQSSKPSLTNDLNQYIQFAKMHTGKMRAVSENIQDKTLADSAKFNLINEAYNTDIDNIVNKFKGPIAEKLAVDTYFDYTQILRRPAIDLLTKYQLSLKNKPPTKGPLEFFVMYSARYPMFKQENQKFYQMSASYRNFIFDYIRFNSPFNSSMSSSTDVYETAFALKEYHLGLALLSIPEIRDWYVTKSIFEDFEHYPFTDAVSVYKDYMTKVKSPYYADTLKKYFSQIQRLKPGTPAPIFSLKDENGKTVSLNSFKGKNVYIDFWGVHCGPCIFDITNNVPKLHEKYKDKDVVFVNICVDVDAKTWKENLKKLNLHGVNLLAENWTKNPVCMAYNINAIPHYYLLNSFGKIVDNNSKRPGEGIETDIDKLLTP